MSSYYRENLPELIINLKIMCDLNLEVIDIELNPHEDDYNELLNAENELVEIIGKDLTKQVLRSGKQISVTEDKLHNVIKSREQAAKDYDWGLTKITELQTELSKKEDDKSVKQSWAKRAASKNKI